MSERPPGPPDDPTRDGASGGLATYAGPAHAAPYPMSRMAPSFSLVDVAREIEKADGTLAAMATAELEVIARQMAALKAEAERVLARTKRDAELHRVKCNFEKRPGGVYHLYRRHTGELYFSLMAPHEWSTKPAQDFVASYRLEANQSFSPLEEASARDEERARALRLLGAASLGGEGDR